MDGTYVCDDTNSHCNNTAGGYTCDCNEGYSGSPCSGMHCNWQLGWLVIMWYKISMNAQVVPIRVVCIHIVTIPLEAIHVIVIKGFQDPLVKVWISNY